MNCCALVDQYKQIVFKVISNYVWIIQVVKKQMYTAMIETAKVLIVRT